MYLAAKAYDYETCLLSGEDTADAGNKFLEEIVRTRSLGRIVNGQGADTDIVIASAKAYINGCNKLLEPVQRAHPQGGDV